MGTGQKGEGIGSLVRLVEALEMYDNGAMDSYMTEESMESAALMKGGGGRHQRKVPHALLNNPFPGINASQLNDMQKSDQAKSTSTALHALG